MKDKKLLILLTFLAIMVASFPGCTENKITKEKEEEAIPPSKDEAGNKDKNESPFVVYTAEPATDNINFFWKDDNNGIMGSLGKLKDFAEGKNEELVFATNGGMFTTERGPVGLFIQSGKEIRPIKYIPRGRKFSSASQWRILYH